MFSLSIIRLLFVIYFVTKSQADDAVFRYNVQHEEMLPFLKLRALMKKVDAERVDEIFQHTTSLQDVKDDLDFIRRILYPIIPTAFSDNVGPQCKEDSQTYFKSVLNYTAWALRMYDSSSVAAPGLFSGNVHATGHFDQCITTRNERFRGKYCTAMYLPFRYDNSSQSSNSSSQLGTASGPMFLSLQSSSSIFNMNPLQQRGLFQFLQLLGLSGRPFPAEFLDTSYAVMAQTYPSVSLCLPSTCNGTEVRNAFVDSLGSYIYGDEESGFVTLTYVGDEYCYTETKTTQFDSGDIAMMVILSLIGLLVVASTIFEMVSGYLLGEPVLTSRSAREKKYVRYLCVFSLVNNCKKLFSTRTNEGSIQCVHGIRFLSMTWVVMGHTWSNINNYNNMNTASLLARITNWFLQTILNATVAVDTFFVLSGLLAAYLLLVQLDKSKGRFNPLMVYLHRYLRLTPVYAIILGFNATLIVYLSSGPYWNVLHFFTDGCRRVWWQHLLYVNNLVTRAPEDQCMWETWYMAVDTQLFLIIPIVVYPLWRWKKAGLVWLAFLTVASLAGNLILFSIYDALPSLIPARSDGDMWATNEAYLKPWFRAPSYLTGILVGWTLYVTRKRRVEMPKVVVVVGWVCAITTACAVLYGLTPYGNPGTEIPKAESVAYGSFHRFVWSLAIGWLVFTCANGYGGYVNDFLSWSAFVPLGRLTYCVYLTHYTLLLVYTSSQKIMFYYSDFNAIYAYFGTLMVSLGLAFILTVCVETPLMLLEKMLLGGTSKGIAKTSPEPGQADLEENFQKKEAYDKQQ